MSQACTEDGKAPRFIVTQPQPSTAQLALKRSVLLAQEFDYVPLFAFDPSEQRCEKKMQRNHRASLRQCLVDTVLRHYAVGCELSSIGHELHHALEVLGNPKIIDNQTLAHLYIREGEATHDDNGFETESAIEAGLQVEKELHARAMCRG